MLYDFHVHTLKYSTCSQSSAESFCRKAVELGIAGIAFTEHDIWWPANEFHELQAKFPGLIIFIGIEYSCIEGHFLVFIPCPDEGNDINSESILDLIPSVHQKNGIVIWAHPFRYDRSYPRWLCDALIDGIEVNSVNIDNKAKVLASKVAKDRNLVTFRNSDAHHVDMLGKYYNDIPVPLNNVREFISYVKLNNP